MEKNSSNNNKWLSSAVRTRINEHNRNWLAIVCGGTGSGKSYSAMRLCCNIDPTFNIDRVVFSVDAFMKLLGSGKISKGNAIIFDEAGVGISSKEWYSISNKLMGYLLQTFRNLNLAVVFTTPNLGYIDKQARGLFHCYIETIRIMKKKNLVRAKIKLIKYGMDGKIMTPYPRAYIKGTKRVLVISKYNFSMPPPELVKAYEEKADRWKKGLRKEIEKEVDDMTKTAQSGRPSKLGTRETMFIANQLNRKVPNKIIAEKVFSRYGIKITPQGISWLKFKLKRGIYDR